MQKERKNFVILCLMDLRQTYDKHYRPLCFFARRWTGDIAEAEDVVQDVFVKLAERRPEFDNATALSAYLHRMVYNACINRSTAAQIHRRHRRLIALNIANEAELAEAELEDGVLWRILSEIDALPTECARVFRMSYMEGASIADVARRLGISPHTVKSQRARARKLLHQRLQDLYSLCAWLFMM